MKATTAMKPVKQLFSAVLLLLIAAQFSFAQTSAALDQMDDAVEDFVTQSQDLQSVFLSCNYAGDLCCVNEAAVNQMLPALNNLGQQIRQLAVTTGYQFRLMARVNQMNAHLRSINGKIHCLSTAPAGSARFYSTLDDATEDIDNARTVAEGIRVEIQNIKNGN